MKIKLLTKEQQEVEITTNDSQKEYCGKFNITDWLDGGVCGYDDQFNSRAVVILTKFIKTHFIFK